MFPAIKRLFSEEFNTLFFLNLLVAALCLPIVTIGPALLAMTGTLVKILDNRCGLNRVKEFWHLFRTKFWQGILLEALVVAYAAILLMSQTLSLQLGEFSDVLLVLVLILSVVAAMVSVCLCVILASVKIPFGQALWNSILMALGRFPRVFASTLCAYGVAYLGILFYPDSLFPLAIILISATAAVSLSCIWPDLNELVLSQCEDEESTRMPH